MPPNRDPTAIVGADGKKLIRRLASSFAACKEDAAKYGACVKLHFDSVQHNACEAEFKALQKCFTKQIGKARASGN